MVAIAKAHRFITSAPREAISDALGMAGLCLLIFAGFMVPAFL